MAQKAPQGPPAKAKSTREDRLKAALKANMARRKAQMRARSGEGGETAPGEEAGKDRNRG